MSSESLVFWAFAVAWLIVFALLVFVQLPRIVREAMRIVKRVRALAEESPLPLQIAKAEVDAARVQRALERLPILERRVASALTVIRTAPLVPPALRGLALRLSREIEAFRRQYR